MSKEKFTAILGAGSEYNGILKFEGTVCINGKFTGDIISDDKLILFQDACITGTITVGELVVNGTVNAEINVARSAFLHSTAKVYGSLSTAKLAMEEGAILHGSLNMTNEKKNSVLSTSNSTDKQILDHIKQ